MSMKTKNIGYFLVVIITGLMLYLFLGILSFQYQEDYRSTAAKELLKANRISIFVGFGFPEEIQMKEYLNDESAFYNIQATYVEMANMEGFREVYPVLLQIIGEYKGERKFINGYENIPEDEIDSYIEQEVFNEAGDKIEVTNIKGSILSEKMAEQYKINQQITIGEMFTQEDYQLGEEPVSVLLGYAYREQYKIGDVIHSLYNGIEMEFKVKGFLEKGAFVDFSKELLPLDYHIVLPALQVSEQQYNDGTAQEKYAYATHYIYKMNGELVCNDEKDVLQLLTVLEDAKNKHQIPIYYNNLDEDYETNKSIMESLVVSRDNRILAGVEMIIISLGMILIFILSYRKERKDYAVRLLCGASLGQVKRLVFRKFLVSLLAGYLIAVGIFFYQKRMEFSIVVIEMSSGVALYLMISILVISSIVANIYINRTEVYLSLREE